MVSRLQHERVVPTGHARGGFWLQVLDLWDASGVVGGTEDTAVGPEGDAYVVRFKVGRSDRDHVNCLHGVISVRTRNHCTLALCLDDSSQSDAVRELIEIGFGPQFLADLAVEAVERHVRRYRYDPECTVCGTVGYLSGAESQTVRTYLLLHVCAPLPQPVLRHINLTGLPSSGTLYSTVLHSSTR